jgi:uncharacterized protein (TIGR00255 family)
MTGFGEARRSWDGPQGAIAVVVELRAVNARFLELKLRHPFGGAVEAELKKVLEARLGRGRVDVAVRLETSVPERGGLSGVGVDGSRLMRAIAGLRDAERIAAREGVAVASTSAVELLRFAATLTPEFSPSVDLPLPEVVAAAEQALTSLDAMRVREGEALARALAEQADVLEACAAKLRALVAVEPARLYARLGERIAELLGAPVTTPAAPPLDPGRLAMEVATLVARGDVTEELDRIASHVAQIRGVLAEAPRRGQGKTLDFLAQELVRELTTVGAKITSHPAIVEIIAAKEAVERMREQVQNVE